MTRLGRLTTLVLSIAAASSALAACQAIAGIEDRTYVADDAGADTDRDAGALPSRECSDYCSKSRTVCGDLLYRTDETCLATCALMPLKGKDTNSVACRSQELDRAVATDEDLERYCANAGPGGNGVCGSNCESYCHLFAQACTNDFKKYANLAGEDDDGTAVCVAKCQGLTDTHLYDSTNEGNYLGDTLQCRIVHTTSSTIDPLGHCAHADLKSTKCLDDPEREPDCATFCHLEMTECADYPIYESEAQCLDVCQALPPGHNGDQSGNTVACRMYHSYNSIIDPKSHCPHTSPGGDGHCGSTELPKTGNSGNCESYCLLLAKACSADFDASFANQKECQADCVELEGAAPNSGYTTASAKGDNLQCRLLHVSQALSDTGECAAAQGAAPCK